MTGIKNRLANALLTTIMPDGTVPTSTCNDKTVLADIIHVINSGAALNEDEEFQIICDMRKLNIRGNTEKSKFELFREYAGRTLELENGSGAQDKRHPREDEQSTANVSYAPMIVSILQLIEKTVKRLTDDGKVKGVDFIIPSKSWVEL